MARLPCDCIGVRAEVHLTCDKPRSQTMAGETFRVETDMSDPLLDHAAK